jgi:hypothetical protein
VLPGERYGVRLPTPSGGEGDRSSSATTTGLAINTAREHWSADRVSDREDSDQLSRGRMSRCRSRRRSGSKPLIINRPVATAKAPKKERSNSA